MKHEVLYEGKYIRLISKDTWEYVERVHCSGVVVIVAVTDAGKLILCEQYRVPIAKPSIELPAGLVNDSAENAEESFEDAAKRELLEETGYCAERMHSLFEGPAASGSSSVMLSFFRAEGLRKVHQGGGDATEQISVHEVRIDEIDSWFREQSSRGKLIDPKVFTALYFLSHGHISSRRK